jgi:hypothetical protein
MINAFWEDLEFGIYAETPGGWRRAVDTSLSSPDDIVVPGDEVPLVEPCYRVRARSIVVLVGSS